MIHGGSALNIVPARCELELEIRSLPQDDPAALVAAIRGDATAAAEAMHGDADTRIELDLMYEYPGLETAAGCGGSGTGRRVTGNREHIKVAFGSEGGLFSVGWASRPWYAGPDRSIRRTRPDEFVAIDQLQRCDAMLDALLDRLA